MLVSRVLMSEAMSSEVFPMLVSFALMPRNVFVPVSIFVSMVSRISECRWLPILAADGEVFRKFLFLF
jgi:hypothetical protein